jgi:hypothetical protein
MSCAELCDGSCTLYNTVQVKLYTPKSAVRAMLAGRILHGEGGVTCWWGSAAPGTSPCFWKKYPNGDFQTLNDFSGLWEEF